MKTDYTISTNNAKLDVEVIYTYLSKSSYWAQGRTKRQVQLTIDHCLCFGVYQDEKQVGFGRVLTDHAVFAWLMDVFILPEHQGQGLGKLLMTTIVNHPELQGISSFGLATKDAHGLYEQYGFTSIDKLERPSKYMFKSKS